MSRNGRVLKDRILEEATGLLLREGFEKVSMRRIAAAVGCTATALYLHFPAKDHLVHALIEEGLGRLNGELEDVAARTADPRARLEELSRTYLQFGLSHPEYYEIMFHLRPEGLERFPAERYRRGRRGLELFAEAITDAGATGSTDGSSALRKATLLWGTLHGTLALIHAHRVDASVDREDLLADAVTHATRLLDDPLARPAT